MRTSCLHTSIGILYIRYEEIGDVTTIHSISFSCSDDKMEPLVHSIQSKIQQYLIGTECDIDIPIGLLSGTIFQKKVWQETQKVPYGETRTYADIAKYIGKPKAYRAVANACGRNPVLLIVPCHRIVATNGRLGGYVGGVERKRFLLELEKKFAKRE
jgi:O-6-methylguanine DNA methyltransferase